MTLLLSWCIGLTSVAAAIVIHAKAIRLIRLGQSNDPFSITWVVTGLFFTHLLEVGLFGAAYYLEAEYLGLGSLAGTHDFIEHGYLYYSIATYTSLGIGDLFPTGALRLLTGLEVLTGLLLIGWSASFLYVEMRAAETSTSPSAKSTDPAV